jgi:putative ABC transport system ATP-binding protein
VSTAAPVLVTRELSRTVGGRDIIANFSFEFFSGRIYTIVGPSGAGKSSLLRLFNRLDEPSGGEILFSGGDHCRLDPGRLRRKVGYLFQTPHLFAGTIKGNLLYANEALNEGEMIGLLERVALGSKTPAEPVAGLSGGEAQRVALARLLATGPEVVLLDEPTSSLDPSVTLRIEDTIRHLAERDGLAVVMVTHDPGQALRMGSETLLLVSGRLVEHGPSEQVINQPHTPEGVKYKNRELV